MAPMMMGLVSPMENSPVMSRAKAVVRALPIRLPMKAENSCVRSLPHRNCTRPQQKAETAKSKGPPPKRTQKKPALRAMQRVETRGETDLAGGFLSRSRASWGVSLPSTNRRETVLAWSTRARSVARFWMRRTVEKFSSPPGQIDEEPRGKGDHMDLVEGVMGADARDSLLGPVGFAPAFEQGAGAGVGDLGDDLQ